MISFSVVIPSEKGRAITIPGTILVAGGAGYIGSHVVRALLDVGYDPVVYDNLSRGHPQAVPPGVPLIKGDIGNTQTLGRTIRDFRVEGVLHFAADSLVGESMANPRRYFENNVGQGLVFLRTLLEHGVKNLVFSSTAAVYGDPVVRPLDRLATDRPTDGHLSNQKDLLYLTEDRPLRPTNPYGESKAFFETALARYAAAYGLRAIALRYFNAAGAHFSGEIGEDHEPETHLIPLVLKVALGQSEKIIVYGNDYPTSDGSPIRDYIHVDDLAQAHILALKVLLDPERPGGSKAYNLGNGHGYSVLEVIEVAREVTGRKIPLEIGPRRAGDPAILVASSERARQDLGWEPRHPDLRRIIASAWEWHRRHPGGYLQQARTPGNQKPLPGRPSLAE